MALCTARATELLGQRPEHISVLLSANILKNGDWELVFLERE